MTGFATSLIERAIKIINDPEFLNVSKTKAEYFTRKRKLCFHDVMALCLNILVKSVQIKISDFIKKHMPSLDFYTKQAFSKARANIRPEAFRSLF